MAEAARSMGLAYFGICDHSQSLTIANGLSPADVQEQQAEVQALNDEFAADDGPPFRLFHGIESDILKDGALDYADDVLAAFDFVVASIHSGFNMSTAEATERLIRAIENPYTTILGHATGRLLLVREGYPIDHERVIEACATHGVAIELNANPHRLDMDWRWIRTATDQGVLIAINPDAHATEELHNVRWGVAAARKGWLTPDQCLNAKSLEAFSDWLADRHVSRVA
jgi:DNA polymerase (family 10)